MSKPAIGACVAALVAIGASQCGVPAIAQPKTAAEWQALQDAELARIEKQMDAWQKDTKAKTDAFFAQKDPKSGLNVSELFQCMNGTFAQMDRCPPALRGKKP